MSGTWIDPQFRDSAWWLWHKLFMCRVSNLKTMSVDYVKIFGMPASGVTEHDKETANELVIRMLSINQMVEFFRQNITVHVVNYRDTKEIYERISDHLNAWKEKLATGINVRNAPIDDLLLLDQFSNAIYKYAAPQFTTAIVDSILARRISGTLRVNRENVLAPMKPKTINPVSGEEVPVEDKRPERISMAESFARTPNMAGASTRWK